MQKRIITTHHGDPVNDQLGLQAVGEDGAGGAPGRYWIVVDGTVVQTFEFVGAGVAVGDTNEILLAIVEDRLRGFQKGPFACNDNAEALINVQDALEALKARSKKRIAQHVEGQLVKHSEAEAAQKATVIDTGDTVVIGTTEFNKADLAGSWASWSVVEAAIKTLGVPLVPAEWAVLEALAITPAARNGFNEVKSALSKTAKA